MLRGLRAALLMLVAAGMCGCELGTEPDEVSTEAEVLLTAVPEPAPSVRSSGKTYVVTRTDKPDEVREYDWLSSFTVSLTETKGVGVDITAVTVRVQQAFGGIVAPPTTGDVEHYEFVSRPSGSRLEGRGTVTVGFDVWYDLPNLGREALVSVTFNFLDKNEDLDDDKTDDNDDLNNVSFSKSVTVRVQ